MYRSKLRLMLGSVAVAGLLALAACGGGGGGSSNNSSSNSSSGQSGGVTTPPVAPPTATEQLQGNFDVSAAPGFTDANGNTVTYKAFVTPDTTFLMVDSNCNLYTGNLGTQGATTTSSLIGTQYLPMTCNGVTKATPQGALISTGFSATGTLPTGASAAYSLTYQGPPANATWTFTPTTDNARVVSNPLLLNSTFKSADGALTLTFPTTGEVNGSLVVGGATQAVTGDLSVQRGVGSSTVPLNQYAMSLFINNIKYTAYASLDDNGSSSQNALTLIAFAGRNVIQETLIKQ